MTPSDRADLVEFFALISQRLEAGAEEYGDSAKHRPTRELCDESEEEALDICGWSFWMWRRIRKLRVQLEEVETRT